jgi:glyoxylate reductase
MPTHKLYIPQPVAPTAMARLDQNPDLDVEIFPHTDRQVTKQELLEAVKDASILWALGEIPFDADVIAAAERLEFIAAMHTRASFVDIAAATARDIPVSGTTALNRTSVAELTMALIIGLAWRTIEADRFTREGRWQQNQSEAFITTSLYDKTVGIVGFGRIGQAVARRCQAFGMDVVYTKRTRMSLDEEREFRAQWREVDGLFRESDFVVMLCPLTKDTLRMVDRRRLELMKPSAFFVNSARGELVVEQDLIDVLAEGRIAGAGLDVYENEIPHPSPGPTEAMKALDNVVFTPHIGSATRESRDLMAGMTVDCIEAFMRGERPPVVLNPEVYGDAPIHDERLS